MQNTIASMAKVCFIGLFLCFMTVFVGSLPVQAQALEQEIDRTAIDTFIQQQMQEQRIPGLGLAIVHNDQIVYSNGYGDSGTNAQPVTAQTPFYIGSANKPVTATAIMQLVEAGKFELDAPVQRYIPWFSLADEQASARITVRHLLNQTSGIAGNVSPEVKVWVYNSPYSSLEAYVRELRNIPLTNPAGSTFEYSNTNYAILGLLIEKASGISYSTYMERFVFEPLGMKQSATGDDAVQREGLAHGHQLWFGFPRSADTPNLENIGPAGYMTASAEDMARFMLMHMNKGQVGQTPFLSEEGIQQLRTPPAQPENSSYAMGWVKGKLDDEQSLYFHNGSVSTSYSAMMFSPENKWGVVVLTNVGGIQYVANGLIDQVTAGILSKVAGGELIQPTTSVGQVYIVINIIVGIVTLVVVARLLLLPLWAKRFARRLRIWRRRWLIYTLLGVLLVIDLVLPLIILLPSLVNGFEFSRSLAINMPDLISWFWVIVGLWLVLGIGRTWLAVRAWQKYRRESVQVGENKGVEQSFA